MLNEKSLAKVGIAARQNIKERDFWLNKLADLPVKSTFPYDNKNGGKGGSPGEINPSGTVTFRIAGEHFIRLAKLSSGNFHTQHMVLTAGLVVLLARYTGRKDIILGTTIYKQDSDIKFINTVLALRNRLEREDTFKDLLMRVRETIIEAVEHQNYPIEVLAEQLDLPGFRDGFHFPLFDVALLVENIQTREYIRDIKTNMTFYFSITNDAVEGEVEFNSLVYEKATAARIAGHFINLVQAGLSEPDRKIIDLEMLSDREKRRLLEEFNDTAAEYPLYKTIHRWVEEQAARTGDRVAVTGRGHVSRDREENAGGAAARFAVPEPGTMALTYKELNKRANQLAHLLKKNNVTAGSVVGLIMNRSIEAVIGLLAILKAGGAYLPIGPGLPPGRIRYMLNDAGALFVLTNTRIIEKIPFTSLQAVASHREAGIVVTGLRSPIESFYNLPVPDRSLIDLKKYEGKIGMASTTGCISIQATRGCPYRCIFCHKVWSKKHTFRSAENIYDEIEYYYKRGVTNFSFLDDCFNLNLDNGLRLFKLLIKNGLNSQVRLFFPNGMRGDIMSPDYIDLMIEGGTRGINLSLETASPRLQQLIKKNLDIDKFKETMDYIAGHYPGVILEIATMHGFPTETEEEALMTLDFIKGIRWLHFPYIHILKIYPNTEMEALALQHGVSKQDILASRDLAYHELPETLPFPKSFTRKYQTDFLDQYFLSRERLKQVLPVQMQILDSRALVEKYNTYLPIEIRNFEDIIAFTGIDSITHPKKEKETDKNEPRAKAFAAEISHKSKLEIPSGRRRQEEPKKILFLDLSQHFSSDSKAMLYNVSEQPLGLLYLLTYLKRAFGDKIDGKIYKSGIDFDSFDQLRTLVEAYAPDVVGIRALTFYKEFFHETLSLLRQWGVDSPVIAGGPYATGDYDTLLQDENVDLAVLGEGEYTMAELIEKMLECDFEIPPAEILRTIDGIAFCPTPCRSRSVLLLDRLSGSLDREDPGSPAAVTGAGLPAYVMYTSGSTGRPKGVMVEHRQVNNCICWMQDKFDLGETDIIVQRTNLTFDPSVWEVFWPLYVGGTTYVLTDDQSRDAEFLLRLMSEPGGLTMMYCPATLVTAMASILKANPVNGRLKLPWLIIGAEPIAMDVVKCFYRYFEGKIVNTYGPTECTINNSYYDLDPADERSIVPIGKPVANNNICILSPDLQLVPEGAAGEICIAGDSVARGYINNPGKTDAAFIENPFGTGKLYRSGDIGRWLEDGSIGIMGRMDDQVKIRGHRIELGEIEAALTTHPSVKESVVVVKDDRQTAAEPVSCKRCGIASVYPGIRINSDGFCDICEEFGKWKKHIDDYFAAPADLEQTIRDANREEKGKYDCLLLYSGGRGAAYALYRLVDMGLNVMTITYDNGYFGRKDLGNIKKITSGLGVDNIVLTHKNSDKIMQESMNEASTVCRGCFHTSGALAGEYSYKNNIPVVVGATLSRGQIIENKLFMFLRQGITGVRELENEILKLSKSAPAIDKRIFQYIDIDEVSGGSVHNKVKFVDFYRYCDVTNEEMIAYLDNRDPYWKSRKRYAVYSTNCPIKQLGDYGHLLEKGYHYYGSATGWERRLGHITLENIEQDLQNNVTQKGFANFINGIGYRPGKEKKGEDENGHSLCAYITAGEDVSISHLREHLSGKLPGYMIPNYFVLLDKIPLTPNGKVDRNMLPAPKITTDETFAAPRDHLEKKLVDIWADVLGIEKEVIGIDSSYFELGGHSLNATLLVSRIHKESNVKIPLSEIFVSPTIRHLAQYIKAAAEDMHISVEPVEKREYYKLSSAQERLFVLDEIGNVSTAYNLPQVMTITRSATAADDAAERYSPQESGLRFRHVFQTLVERHEALRTSFALIDKNPVQVIRNDIEFEIEYYEEEPAVDGQVAKTVGGITGDFIRPFDLSRAPLLRVGLILPAPPPGHESRTREEEPGDRAILMIDMHHIVSDAVSLSVLVQDFVKLYEGNRLAPMAIQYKDFSQWQDSPVGKRKQKEAEQYWLGRLSGELPVLNMPTDNPRPPIQDFAGDRISFQVDSRLTREIRNIISGTSTTMYTVLMAIYTILLSKYTGQEDIIVGVPAAGRNHADIENVIGIFVNTLAMRGFPESHKTFAQFLEEMRKDALDAYENQAYPFEELVDKLNITRDFSRNPVFDVLFVSQNVDTPELEVKGLRFSPYVFSNKTTHLDLVLYTSENDDRVNMVLEYSTALFKPASAEKITRRYIEILEQVAADVDIKLNDIEVAIEFSETKPGQGYDEYVGFEF